jgi:hypothetical protein
MHAKDIINLLGGQTALAAALGKGQSTVGYWAKVGVVPAKWQEPLLNLAREKGIDLTANDFVNSNKVALAAQKLNGGNELVLKMPSKLASKQAHLDLGIQRQIEIDGVGMGVLSDGTPFLTGRGLARLCGVFHNAIQGLSEEWGQVLPTPRVSKIRDILASHGHTLDQLYIEVEQRSGTFFAYPDTACLAVLE